MSFQELPASPPLTNVDRALVNADGSTYAANFTSTVNPATVNPGALPEPTSKVAKKGGAWRSRKQRGGMPNYPLGHTQYQNNMPMTQTYSVGGPLASSESALANPPPIKTLDNCVNCVDNYSKFSGEGFPSRGWF